MRVSASDREEGWTDRAVTPFIATTGVLFLVGLALLAFGVWFDLPGPLSAYGDPSAGWPIFLQMLLGLASFGTWRWVNRRNSRPFAVVLLGLGILTVLILSSASYSVCQDPGLSSGWNVVSRVVGLLTNNYAVDQFGLEGCRFNKYPPLALQFARLAQLLVLLVAATSAVTALLRTQVDRVAARTAPRLSLVLGADDVASALLPALASGTERGTLAVLTPDPLAPWLGRARAAGWRVVIGDPHNEALLRSLLVRPGGRRALRRLSVLAPDSTETQRLVDAVERAVEGTTAKEPVRALLRIDDAWQAEDWRRRYLGRTDQWIVDTISENEVTARLLVEDGLLRGVRTLIVTGHSDLTFAVLAEVAQQARERAVLEDGRPMPEVILVGPTAQEVLDEHVLSQARFGNQVTVTIIVEATDRLVDVVHRAIDSHQPTAVLFTGDVESADQRLAARLGATYPGLRVYSRRTEVVGLGEDPLLAEVRAFGTTLDAGGGRPVDSWERIARLAHQRFILAFPDASLPSRRPWDEGLPRFYRESNVRQVLTTLVSAVDVGRSWGASSATATAPPSAEQLERMAQEEHESWREHHLHNGWTHAAVRDDEHKRHPDLVPWDQLSDASRAKTRALVTSTLELLTTLGYRSFDDPKRQWQDYRRTGEVTAVRRDEAWTWTLADDTEMHGSAGDWAVTDGESSRSVKDSIFRATHEHLAGDRYRRTGTIQARPAVAGEVVDSLEGAATAHPGQYVMRGSEGEEWLISEDHLHSAYEPVADA